MLYFLAIVARSDLTFLFGMFLPRCTHDINKFFNDYHVIQYSHGGGVELCIDQTITRMEGRWWWSSYPGPRISFKPLAPSQNWVHRYLAFRGSAVDQWQADGLFPIPPMPAPVFTNGLDSAARFDHMLQLSRQEDALSRQRATLELELLLCDLAEARARSSQADAASPPPWLSATKARLEALGVADVDYPTLAAEAGISARTFRRDFARWTGLAPHSYLIASRISHAREMLAHTDLPLKVISREVGYSDVFYFTRHFRKVVGVPPGLYRKSRDG